MMNTCPWKRIQVEIAYVVIYDFVACTNNLLQQCVEEYKNGNISGVTHHLGEICTYISIEQDREPKERRHYYQLFLDSPHRQRIFPQQLEHTRVLQVAKICRAALMALPVTLAAELFHIAAMQCVLLCSGCPIEDGRQIKAHSHAHSRLLAFNSNYSRKNLSFQD